MKRLNFNIKDRKVLTIGLCLILVCVFTLTIAYAALNAVLTISGSAQVISADWDIHLANPKVTSGSATTTVPSISGNTLIFSTTLKTPGDFFEFTVDVVNGGSIAAMIDKVTKTPELTAEQAKYLKYEVSYANGESINDSQIIASGVTMPIKVRVEYRKDLVASDLPSTSTTLNMSLTLEYIQSNDNTSSVPNNGVSTMISANGSVEKIGTIVTIGDQQFYTIGTDGNNVKLLSMYNLYVGGEYDKNDIIWTEYGDEATGKQDPLMIGYVFGEPTPRGTTVYSHVGSMYAESVVEGYVNNYKNILETYYGVDVVEARLITYDELTNSDIRCSTDEIGCRTSDYEWIYLTSYWVGTEYDSLSVWFVDSVGGFSGLSYENSLYGGVRPIIVISKDLIIESEVENKKMIDDLHLEQYNLSFFESYIGNYYNINMPSDADLRLRVYANATANSDDGAYVVADNIELNQCLTSFMVPSENYKIVIYDANNVYEGEYLIEYYKAGYGLSPC